LGSSAFLVAVFNQYKEKCFFPSSTTPSRTKEVAPWPAHAHLKPQMDAPFALSMRRDSNKLLVSLAGAGKPMSVLVEDQDTVLDLKRKIAKVNSFVGVSMHM